jgi:uncharacterized protein (TIGR02452 family)
MSIKLDLNNSNLLCDQLRYINHREIAFSKRKDEGTISLKTLEKYTQQMKALKESLLPICSPDLKMNPQIHQDLELILKKVKKFEVRLEKWNKKLASTRGIQSAQSTSFSPLQQIESQLKQIVQHFQKGNKPEAYKMLNEFIKKYPSLRGEIGGHHWRIIEQKQIWGYGEKAFFDEDGCTSTNDQKAKTMEHCIPTILSHAQKELSESQAASLKQEEKSKLIPVQKPPFLSPEPTLADQIKSIAQKFKENKKDEALKDCKSLCNKYPKLYNLIGGEHWKIIDKPQSPPWGYGEKAFFEWDGCSSPCDKKADALLACIPLIQDAPAKAQKLIDGIKRYWDQINNEAIPGHQKHQRKMDSIHQLTKDLLGLIDRGEAVEQFQKDSTCQQMTPLIHHYKNKYTPIAPYLGQLIREMDRKSGCTPNIDPNDVSAQKDYRKKVFMDTLSSLQNGYYISPNGTKHDLTKEIAAGRQGLTMYMDGGPQRQHNPQYDTLIMADSRDCINLALMYKKMGCNPALLDMAADRVPLGDPYDGARAQEEEMSRRSTLAAILDPNYQHKNDNLYPIHKKVGDKGGYYLPCVKLIADGYSTGYQYLDQPDSVAVLVSAAYRKPELDMQDKKNPKIKDQTVVDNTREKIRTQLKMAFDHGHDTVILSAFGCGAFGNPPRQIAEMYMDVINKEFPCCFKYIIFSIFDDHNTGREHNPEGNFKPFAEVVKQNGGLVCSF